MLTKMPKVGDKIRFIGDFTDYLTPGDVYTVVGTDDDGDPYIRDNDGDDYVIHTDHHLREFMPFTDTEEYPGYIEVKQSTHNSEEATFEVVLVADEKGYASIKALVERSQTGIKRAELERKIAELQAELDAL